MEVHFEADVRIDNGQLFQVVVDGVVQTGGNITTPAVNRRLVVALSPGNHFVEFVYTWYPPEDQTDLPTTTTGVVRIFSVTLPSPGRFPTSSPTDVPSTSPTTTPPTGKPTPRPTVSIEVHLLKIMKFALLEMFIRLINHALPFHFPSEISNSEPYIEPDGK